MIRGHSGTHATLHVPAERRGYLKPGRFVLFTRFPLGLFRAWSWLEFDVHVLAYPKPEVSALAPILETSNNHQSKTYNSVKGCDDYAGLREYQPGDPPRHIACKTLARTQLMSTKQFSGESSDEVWLDFDTINDSDIEKRLSILCYWVIEFQSTGRYFGMRLPNQRIAPASGSDHTQCCLRALGRFGQQSSDD